MMRGILTCHSTGGLALSMRLRLIVPTLLLLAAVGVAQTPTRSDPWAPLRALVGTWEGTGNGQPGQSKVQREYRFVLNDKYIQVQNKSTYDPQPKNPKGKFIRTGG